VSEQRDDLLLRIEAEIGREGGRRAPLLAVTDAAGHEPAAGLARG
jgi:hypothetical protein